MSQDTEKQQRIDHFLRVWKTIPPHRYIYLRLAIEHWSSDISVMFVVLDEVNLLRAGGAVVRVITAIPDTVLKWAIEIEQWDNFAWEALDLIKEGA